MTCGMFMLLILFLTPLVCACGLVAVALMLVRLIREILTVHQKPETK